MSILLILVLAGLMSAARSFDVSGLPHSVSAGLAFGYVLLTAFFAGKLFQRVKLPRLTGYIMAGILVGPSVLGLLTPVMVQQLRIVNGVAIALIALTAGNELDLRTFRPLFRSIGWITGVAVVGTALLLAVAVYASRGLLPFAALMNLEESIAIALVLGTVMAAQSPAVVVALRDEMEADGPMSRTVLGVVVIADLVVILLFAITSSVAKSIFGAPGDVVDTMAKLAWEIFGSLGSGILAGMLIATYLRKVPRGGALFVLTVAFVVAEVGERIHFDPLLVALAAGMFIRNASSAGPRLHHVIDLSALPVYVIFFAGAGANLPLDILLVVGLPAALYVGVRAAGLLTGARIGARLSGAPVAVRRWAGFGLLPQSGLALALALLFSSTFPEFGREASALVLGVVALNELTGPILFRLALVRSGEAGAKRETVTQPEDAEAAGGAAPPSFPQAPRGP
ncbi:cation:proton antiporter [Vulgatibacter sp.]|uniref:cation:proton antiporter n=1 Tax=Vulgatibacter sp. TaxID=1971226 RepID=UPI003569AD2A